MNYIQTWSEKYRPTKLEDIILSEYNRHYFSSLKGISNNYLFIGNSGTGKNTLTYYLRDKFAPNSNLYINASVESGIDTVRNKISDFVGTCSFDGNPKLVILSEADRFSNDAQDALREIMEENLSDVRFILTGNFSHKIRDAIKSRCESFSFTFDRKEVNLRIVKILTEEKIVNWKDYSDYVRLVISKNFPDIRKILNELQKCCVTGTFIPDIVGNVNFAKMIIQKLNSKEDVFKIRQFVIDNDVEYGNDFHGLIRSLFDCYVLDEKVKPVIMCANYAAEHNKVLDAEMNFTNLLFNLSLLC